MTDFFLREKFTGVYHTVSLLEEHTLSVSNNLASMIKDEWDMDRRERPIIFLIVVFTFILVAAMLGIIAILYLARLTL